MNQDWSSLRDGLVVWYDRDRKIVRLSPGVLAIFVETGIAVQATRSKPEFGSQPMVTINTEEAPPSDAAPNGEPYLEVSLNDVTLYDLEKPDPMARLAERLEAFKRACGELAEVWELTGADDDGLITTSLNFNEIQSAVSEMEVNPAPPAAVIEAVERLRHSNNIDIELERADPAAVRVTQNDLDIVAEYLESR